MNMSFRVAVALSALVAVSPTAFAADLPAATIGKARAASATYDWTGFYVGVNAGQGVGRNSDALISNLFVGTESFATQPAGWLGGGQIGYNWQTGHWLFGVEADLQAAALKDSVCVVRCIPAASATVDREMSWFGTARGRFGYAVGPVLYYATGGLAYGHVDTRVQIVDPPSPTETHVFGTTRTGWTAGGGIEAGLAGSWTARAEYLYIDLGTVSGSFNFANAIEHGFTSDIRAHVFRAGVNYRFDDRAPVAAPLHDWTGFYAGANAGYGVGRHPASFNAVGFQPEGESFSVDPHGVLAGGQIGVNYQMANWVVGLEADLQKTAMKSPDNCMMICSPTGDVMIAVQSKLDWLATLRARAGWASGPSLFYVTGGLALAQTNLHVDYRNLRLVPGLTLETRDVSETTTGWTVGGGIETALSQGWSIKAEYLYVNLGHANAGFDADFGLGFTNTNTVNVDMREHIARVGLNYNFNAGPVAAKY